MRFVAGSGEERAVVMVIFLAVSEGRRFPPKVLLHERVDRVSLGRRTSHDNNLTI
jgi:hypothetical protein